MSEIIWMPNHYKDKKVLFNFNKIKDIYLNIHAMANVGGLIKLEKRLENGMIIPLSSWYHNNVTNVGLDMCYGSNTRYRACIVGTGTALPNNNDVTLQSFLAGTTNISYGTSSFSATVPYYNECQLIYTFPTGAVVGNIGEIAIASTATSGSQAFCREVTRDTSGNPTTLPIQNTEALIVRYKIRHYPPAVDVTGSLNYNAYGSITQNPYTVRSKLAGQSSAYWYPIYQSSLGYAPVYNYSTPVTFLSSGLTTETSSTLGTVISSNESASTNVVSSYTAGSFNVTRTQTFGPTKANGTIKTILFPGMYYSSSAVSTYYQCEFQNAIAKTSLDTLTLGFTFNWNRYL